VRLLVVVSAAMLAVGVLSACGSTTKPVSTVVSPFPAASEVFVAQYGYGAGDTGRGHGTFLALFDLRTGRH